MNKHSNSNIKNIVDKYGPELMARIHQFCSKNGIKKEDFVFEAFVILIIHSYLHYSLTLEESNVLIRQWIDYYKNQDTLNEQDKEMIDSIFQRFNKVYYRINQPFHLKQMGLGDEKVNINGVEIPLTIKKLADFIGEKYANELFIEHSEGIKIQDEYIKFRKGIIEKKEYAKIADKKTDEKNHLYDIWIKDRNQSLKSYDLIIEKLKSKILYETEEFSFVSEINGKLFWNLEKYGAIKYLQGFICVMIEKKWLRNNYSGKEWITILCNTFNIPRKTSPKSFQPSSLNRTSLKEKYLYPFENYESNM